MTKEPKFSIIIPTFNAQDHLKSAIQSVLEQTLTDIELIVVDGASTDATLDLVSKSKSLDNRIKYISEPDQGIYDAMNKGIKLSTGEWIYFLGSDDRLYHLDTLAHVFSQLKNQPLDIFMGNVSIEGSICNQPKTTMHAIWGTIFHQGIIYHHNVFNSTLYSLRFPLLSDRYFNLKLLTSPDVSILRSDITIAHYSKQGLSSGRLDLQYEKERYELERELFLRLIDERTFKVLYLVRRRRLSLQLIEQGHYLWSFREAFKYFLSTFEIAFIKDFLHYLKNYLKRNVFLQKF